MIEGLSKMIIGSGLIRCGALSHDEGDSEFSLPQADQN